MDSNDNNTAQTQLPKKNLNIRQKGIYLLPNSLTLAALFSAFYAITESMHNDFESAALAVFIAMIFDGMDGRVARLTNSQSAFGEQLDSLADMVSFGVAPALIVYNWQLYQFGKLGYSIAFLYCGCAALRLALFNTLIGKVDKRWFIGIPSPTAAALIVSLIWLNHSFGGVGGMEWVALFVTVFAGLTMVMQIPFWSFKVLNFKRKIPFMGLILFVFLLMLIALQPSLSVFLFFLGYSLSGYIHFFWKLKKAGKGLHFIEIDEVDGSDNSECDCEPKSKENN